MLTEYEAVRDINTHICIFIYIRERVVILVVLSFRARKRRIRVMFRKFFV